MLSQLFLAESASLRLCLLSLPKDIGLGSKGMGKISGLPAFEEKIGHRGCPRRDQEARS
jgi:hypothetical protein